MNDLYFTTESGLVKPSELEFTGAGTHVASLQIDLNKGYYGSSWMCPTKSDCEKPFTSHDASRYPPTFRGWALITGYLTKSRIELKDSEDCNCEDHPSQRVINRPHPWFNRYAFWSTVFFHWRKYGQAFAYIERQGTQTDLAVPGGGTPVELSLLDPNTTEPFVEFRRRQDERTMEQVFAEQIDNRVPVTPDQVQEFMSESRAVLYYRVRLQTPQGEKFRKLDYQNVLHFRHLSEDGLVGINQAELHAAEGRLAAASSRYKETWYEKGGVGGGIFMMPDSWLGKTRGKETEAYIDQRSNNSDTWHSKLYLSEKVKHVNTAVTAREAQVDHDREFQLVLAAASSEVPQHKVGGRNLTSYNSLEEENKSMLQDTIDPLFCATEAELDHKLLSIEEQDAGLHFEMDRSKLTQPSFEHRAEAATKLANNGVFTGNMALKLMGKQPSTDPDMDRFRMPLNIGFMNQTDDRLELQVTRQLQRNVRSALVNSASCVFNAAKKATTVEKFESFLNTIEPKYKHRVVNFMEPINGLLDSMQYKQLNGVFDAMSEQLTLKFEEIKDSEDFATEMKDFTMGALAALPDEYELEKIDV